MESLRLFRRDVTIKDVANRGTHSNPGTQGEGGGRTRTGFVQVMENLESQGIKEFHFFIFQAWNVMELNCRALKVMENENSVW